MFAAVAESTLGRMRPSMNTPILRFEDLSLGLPRPGGNRLLVDRLSLELHAGEMLGIVGESGSGKTLTALAALRLLPPPVRRIAGSVRFGETDLESLSNHALRALRGGDIAMIFQDPMTSLNPVLTVGRQIEESVRLHQGLAGSAARTAVVDALAKVRIPDPERRADQYPHELSGGMRQRAMIALALAGGPKVLLADEPTTALDVTVQAQILSLLSDLRKETGLAVLFITHDLGVVAQTCDRVAVMYSGRVMEVADTADLFARPGHPYTRGLLRSLPESVEPGQPLSFIPGQPPLMPGTDAGCPFRTRCNEALSGTCEREVPEQRFASGRRVRCHLPIEGATC